MISLRKNESAGTRAGGSERRIIALEPRCARVRRKWVVDNHRLRYFLIVLLCLFLPGVMRVWAIDSPIDRARACLANGQLEEAKELLNEVIQSNPDSFEAHWLLGSVYVQAKQITEAIPHFEKAINLKPDSPQALRELGDAYLEAGQRGKATSTLARSLALKPDQPTTQYTLGMALVEAGDYTQAAVHLAAARQYGLKHSGVLLNLGRAYLRLKRLDDAVDVLEELLRSDPGNWRIQLEVGKMYLENLLYDSAKPALSRARELNPDSYEAGFYEALVHYLLGEQPESLKVLLEMGTKGAKTLEVENLLGAVYAKLGQTETAVKVLKAAMDEAPDRPDAYFNLGLILLERGNRQEAAALLERAGALYRNDAKVFYILQTQQACQAARQSLEQTPPETQKEKTSPERADFYLRLGKTFAERFHYASAAELLRMAWELNPDNPETLLTFGISCYNLDDLTGSLALYRRAISLQPESDQAYYFLGNNFASLGNHSEAIEAYRKAIQRAPQNDIYRYRLGKVLFREGRTEEALAMFQAADELSPNNAATHCALGRVYWRIKKEDLAFSEFQQAIRIDPGFAESYYYLAQYYARKKQMGEARKFSDAFQRKTAMARRTPGQYAYLRARE